MRSTSVVCQTNSYQMLPPSGVNSLSFSFPFPRVNFPRTSRNFSLTTTTHRHRSCQKRQYLSSQSVRPFLLSDRGGGGGGGGHRKGADLTVRLRQTVSLTDRPTVRQRPLTHSLTHSLTYYALDCPLWSPAVAAEERTANGLAIRRLVSQAVVALARSMLAGWTWMAGKEAI